MIGRKIAHYEVVAKLGSGGMGDVYLGFDTRLGRKVALKFLPPQVTANDELVQRFRREAYAASAINHPNILTIYEVGQADELRYMAAEYVEGVTLRAHMAARPMSLGEVLNVGVQIASALTAAHAAGITHRDIKPENIMLRPDGYIKVLDFGLAKLTEGVNGQYGIDSDAMTRMSVKSTPGLRAGN